MNIEKSASAYNKRFKNFLLRFWNSFTRLLRFIRFMMPGKIVRRETCSTSRPCLELSGSLFVQGYFYYPFGLLGLQKIDLRSGRIEKHVYKGTGHGHSVTLSKSGRAWLIPENGFSIIEFDQRTLKQTNTISSNGNLMGGHGACSSDGKRLYFVDRGTSDESKAIVVSYGRVHSFLLDKFGLLKKFSDKTMRLRSPSFTIIDLNRRMIEHKHAFNDYFMPAHAEIDKNEQFVFIDATDCINFSELTNESSRLIAQKHKILLTLEEKMAKLIFSRQYS